MSRASSCRRRVAGCRSASTASWTPAGSGGGTARGADVLVHAARSSQRTTHCPPDAAAKRPPLSPPPPRISTSCHSRQRTGSRPTFQRAKQRAAHGEHVLQVEHARQELVLTALPADVERRKVRRGVRQRADLLARRVLVAKLAHLVDARLLAGAWGPSQVARSHRATRRTRSPYAPDTRVVCTGAASSAARRSTISRLDQSNRLLQKQPCAIRHARKTVEP